MTHLAAAKLYKWYGRHYKAKFTLKVGPIFEDSALNLEKWLAAMWLMVNSKNGISSCEIARDLGTTQQSAWHMAHRIRFALHEGSFGNMLAGEVEADETFVGGKARNMRTSVKLRHTTGYRNEDKAAAMELLERSGQVRTTVVATRRKHAPSI